MGRVDVDIKTAADSWRAISDRPCRRVSVADTWLKLIQTVTERKMGDPKLFSMKANKGGKRHSLMEKIEVLIKDMEPPENRLYTVYLVENPRKKAPTTPTTFNQNRTITPKPRRLDRLPLPPETVLIPRNQNQDPGPSGTNASRISPLQPLLRTPSTPLEIEIDRPPAHSTRSGGSSVVTLYNGNDFDDSASQVSQVSQLSESSQLNLQEQGIINEEIKKVFVSKINKNLKNSSLLLMRDEFKKVVEDGHLGRISNVSPHVSNFLMQFVYGLKPK